MNSMKIYSPDGCSSRKTEMGANYLRIHYSADPAKDEAWARAERAKSPTREWDREMEMNENVFDGEPVYADYREPWHNCLGDQELPLVHHSVYLGGWDAGQTIHPAFVLIAVTPRPWQIHALLEVIPETPEPMETFAPRVLQALRRRLPGQWDEVRHFGDQTITSKSGDTGQTAQIVARRHGVSITPVSNQLQGRLGAVTWALADSIDEKTPRFLIDGKHCPVLREGFRGAYRYEESAAGEAVGPGRILKEPLKNSYSHVHDALQYACVKARAQILDASLPSKNKIR